jgi:hypothetical protein
MFFAQLCLRACPITFQKPTSVVRRNTPHPDRIQCVIVMERDLPGYVLCTVCEKFESRLSGELEKDLTKYSLLSSKWHGMEKLACAQAKGMLTIDSTFKNGLHVRRQYLDLLLRSATLGTKFGLPISILSQTRSHRMYGENALNVQT